MENRIIRTLTFEEKDFTKALDKALNGGSFKTETINTVMGLVGDFILKENPDKIYLNFRTYINSSILKPYINTVMPQIRSVMTLIAEFCDIDIIICPPEMEETKKLSVGVGNEYREMEHVSCRRNQKKKIEEGE